MRSLDGIEGHAKEPPELGQVTRSLHRITCTMEDMRGSPASPIVCFLDESATDDARADRAVLGGLVMNRRDVQDFEASWSRLLAKYRVNGGVHVSAFGPAGKNAHLTDPECEALYAEAVTVINHVRIFTFGCSLSNRRIESAFSTNARELGASAYGVAFLMCVTVNHESAAFHGYNGPIDYVLDEGNKYRHHIEGMSRAIGTIPELRRFRVGGLTFEDDSGTIPLQAADVVAWATRRRSARRHFQGVLRPLEGLFDEFFVESPLSDAPLRQLAESIALHEQAALGSTASPSA